ncbi:SusE domain-containing protein [Mucilaginibacter sabulilitoris]|uniref:SusE domain-containing protein n=1 Tax=Mucilaginibacter sabulilitoris TaxID=1173583 RepID=A0ABZ0TKG4_9SPHI|nr:SusE domain-containing protein [Mucilaginibacter sabulilitoris]WPU91675.1 SusE domain-containing protein [Mucilaginibacter sabulilitoris]
MKKLIRLSSVILLAIIAISACKKEGRPLNLSLTPVGTLASPADNVDVKLDPTSNGSVLFKWESAAATDGTLVLYEVAFDKAGGDFSKPVYKIVSDGAGVQTQLTLTHKDLNKIANTAGIASSTTGKLIWTVITSKGTNAKAATVSRTIQLERPAGFAENPAELYLTGSATEGGTDRAKAVKLKRVDDGVFETYTSLKAGDYILIDKAGDGGKQYYVESGIIKEGSNPVTVSGAQKTFRLNFDFTSATAKSVEIQSIGLFMSAYNTEIGTLNYTANGVFEAPNVAVEFYQFSWGRDERYKFILHTAAGLEYMGSSAQNNDPPAGKPAAYFYLLPVTNDQWNNTYKFDPSADKKHVKVDVMFTQDALTHKVTVL